jgi:hypothetical protein
MKHSRTRAIRATLVLVVIAAAGALVTVPASAASGQAVGIMTPDNALAGATDIHYGFDLSATSGQISSFNLTPPGGWKILSLSSPPTGVGLVTLTSGIQQIQGRAITASS